MSSIGLPTDQTHSTAGVPKLSIVIPCFNGRDYLAECLTSLTSLTEIPWEALVVDDGSTEDVQSVTRDFSPRVRYVRQPNQGPAAARNLGIRETNGLYVWFLDSDDRLVSPGGLARQVAVFDAHPEVGLVHAKATVVDARGRTLRTRKPPFATSDYIRSGEVELSDLLFGNYITTSCTIVRRTVARQVGFFSTSFFGGEDWDYWLRVACLASFGYVDETVVAYRIHGNSITSRYTPADWLETHVRILDRAFANPRVAQRHAHLRPAINAKLYLAAATIAYWGRQASATRSYAREAAGGSIRSRQYGQAVTCLWIMLKSFLPYSVRQFAKRTRQSFRGALTTQHVAAN